MHDSRITLLCRDQWGQDVATGVLSQGVWVQIKRDASCPRVYKTYPSSMKTTSCFFRSTSHTELGSRGALGTASADGPPPCQVTMHVQIYLDICTYHLTLMYTNLQR